MKLYENRYHMYEKVKNNDNPTIAFVSQYNDYKKSKELLYTRLFQGVPVTSEISAYIKNNRISIYVFKIDIGEINRIMPSIRSNTVTAIESKDVYIPFCSFLKEKDICLALNNKIENIKIKRNLKKMIHFIYAKI